MNIIFLVLFFAFLVFLYKNRARRLKNVPGPPRFPFFGTLGVPKINAIDQWQKQCIDKYGPNFILSRPFLPALMFTADPVVLKHIMKDNFENYPKGNEMIERFEDLLGHGIFNADGHLWKEQRKIASHMFTVSSFRNGMTDVFVENGLLVCKILKQISLRQNAEAIDLQDLFHCYTLDSFTLIAFGVKLGCLEHKLVELQTKWNKDTKVPQNNSNDCQGQNRQNTQKQQINAVSPLEFAAAFDKIQRLIGLRISSPFWKLKRFLSLGKEGEIKKSLAIINAFAEQVIQERERFTPEQLSSRTDLLSFFVSLKKQQAGEEKQTEQERNKYFKDFSQRPLDHNYIRDLILNFMIAGRDTTAQTLSWLFYELLLHPEVLLSCRKEINVNIGGIDAIKKTNNENEGLKQDCYEQKLHLPTFDTINKLKYCLFAIQESLRLHPPVPKELKTTLRDDIWPTTIFHTNPTDKNATLFIPAGTVIIPLIRMLLRREEIWGKDAEKYRPERWLEGIPSIPPSLLEHSNLKTSSNSLHSKPVYSVHAPISLLQEDNNTSSVTMRPNHWKPDEFQFPVFQAGPRTCLGRVMALLEVRILMSMILQRFDLQIVPGQKIEADIAITSPMRTPFYVSVKEL